MTDTRLIPANARVAHASLKGKIEAPAFVEGAWRRMSLPVVDLHAAPDNPRRERQLLFGDRFCVLERGEGWNFGFCEDGGYVGYIATAAIAEDRKITHHVSALATHVYAKPDLKGPLISSLSLGSLLNVAGQEGAFAKLGSGAFVPAAHLSKIGDVATDPVAVAEKFIGTPYLWGGDSRLGIDCSGLVHAAFRACGKVCPRDSDLQQASLGKFLDEKEQVKRGDLVFWKGHVALMRDETTIIHANGNDMAVAHEPLEAAIKRIKSQDGGGITACKRV